MLIRVESGRAINDADRKLPEGRDELIIFRGSMNYGYDEDSDPFFMCPVDMVVRTGDQ